MGLNFAVLFSDKEAWKWAIVNNDKDELITKEDAEISVKFFSEIVKKLGNISSGLAMKIYSESVDFAYDLNDGTIQYEENGNFYSIKELDPDQVENKYGLRIVLEPDELHIYEREMVDFDTIFPELADKKPNISIDELQTISEEVLNRVGEEVMKNAKSYLRSYLISEQEHKPEESKEKDKSGRYVVLYKEDDAEAAYCVFQMPHGHEHNTWRAATYFVKNINPNATVRTCLTWEDCQDLINLADERNLLNDKRSE